MRRLCIIALSLLTHVSFSQVVLEGLPDQVIGREGSFEPIELGDFTTGNAFWEVTYLSPQASETAPAWSVNASNFQFEMNITARVVSKGVEAVGDSHLLAAVDANGQVRAVGSGIKVQEDWIYFLTVYSNQNAEELFFRFYDDSLSQLITGNQSFTFQSNSVLGEPDDPLVVSMSNISFELKEDVLSFQIDDPEFIGSEQLMVTARNLANPLESSSDTLSLTIVDDFTPKLTEIPDQVVSFQENFSAFDLDDFAVLEDNDPVSFSFSGNSELVVAIDEENVFSIAKPVDWSGTELITITISDISNNAFASSQAVAFTGKPQDQAPEILSIADQTTGIGGSFEPILLSNYVVASNPGAIVWEVEVITDSVVAVPDWEVNENEFQFDMSITAAVESMGKRLEGSDHLLAAISATQNKVVGVTQAIQVEEDWFFFLTINGNTEGDSIYFKVYDEHTQRVLPTQAHVFFEPNEIIGDPLDPFAIDAGYLIPQLNGDVLSFELRETAWSGVEIVRISATDTATAQQLSDSDTIALSVLNIASPELLPIPNQTIEEGSNFTPIDVGAYLENVAFSEVSISIAGADTLNPVLDAGVISFSISNEDYFGESILEIEVTSIANPTLTANVQVELNVNNVNDLPVVTSVPPATADIGRLYSYSLSASDADFDQLTVTAENLPSWLFLVPSEGGAIVLGIPVEEDAGDYSFTLEVSDGRSSTFQQIDLQISLARIGVITSQVIDEGSTFSSVDLDDYLIVFGGAATYWSVSEGLELSTSLDAENVLDVQVPDPDWFGKEGIQIRLHSQGDSSVLDETELVYEVLNVNDLPEFLSNPSRTISSGEQLQVKTLVTDIDGDVPTYSLTDAPDWITLFTEIDGYTLFGQPPAVADTVNFEVTADDGSAQVSQSVQLIITNATLNFASIPGQTIDEGQSFSPIDLSEFLTNVAVSEVSVSLSGADTLQPALTDGVISFSIANVDYFGQQTLDIVITSNDNAALTATGRVQLNVNNVNDLPEFLSNPSRTISSSEQLRVRTEVTDIDGDVPTYSLSGAPDWLTIFSEIGGYTLFGQPPAVADTVNFEVTADDGSAQVSQSVQLIITNATLNLSSIPGQTIDEGGNFSPIDLSEFLTNVAVSEVSVGLSGADTLQPELTDGVISFSIANVDYFGQQTLDIVITSNDNPALTATARVQLNVNNVNDLPEFLSNPSRTISSSEQLRVRTEVTDIDGDVPTYSLSGAPDWLTIFSEIGGYTLFGQPPAVADTVNFEVTADDGSAQVLQSVQLIVTNASLNLATIPSQTINEGDSFSPIDLSEFLTNVALNEVNVTLTGADTLQPVLTDGVISFSIANVDYYGQEALNILIKSIAVSNLTASARVELNVNNINDSPTINSVPPANAAVGELYSYRLTANDLDLDRLTFTANRMPSWLSMEPGESAATIFGIPVSDDAGSHSFSVEVSDGQSTVFQQIDILISLARIGEIESQVIDEGSAFATIDLDDYLIAFGETSTFWSVSGGTELTASLDDQHLLNVEIPDPDWHGQEEIVLKLQNREDTSVIDERTLRYEVRNVNDLPVFLLNPSMTITSGEELLVKTEVTDVDGDIPVFWLRDAPEWITLFSEIDGYTLFGRPPSVSATYDFEAVAHDGTSEISQEIRIIVTRLLYTKGEESQVSLFPNPVTDYLRLEVPNDLSEMVILDQVGRSIMYIPSDQRLVDVSFLPEGIYFLRIDNKQTLRFFKQ